MIIIIILFIKLLCGLIKKRGVVMKTLRLLAVAILFAILGTSFVEATPNGCSGWLDAGSCRRYKSCEWKKGRRGRPGKCQVRPKKPKAAIPSTPANIYLNNMIMNQVKVRFFDKQGGTEISAGLTNSILTANPSAEGDQSAVYYVNVPKNATYVIAGPEFNGGDGLISNSGSIGTLSGITAGTTYQITVDNSGNLAIQACTTSTCL
jgi:hypothetical protein